MSTLKLNKPKPREPKTRRIVGVCGTTGGGLWTVTSRRREKNEAFRRRVQEEKIKGRLILGEAKGGRGVTIWILGPEKLKENNVLLISIFKWLCSILRAVLIQFFEKLL